ncbi:MAG: ribbon-helix-helix protein, CopG family [Spirochaetota bacterium]
MEKVQILFPKPQLERLRRLAGMRDRPVSELVRAAVDSWLEKQGDDAPVREAPPTHRCGDILVEHDRLRETAYQDRVGP